MITIPASVPYTNQQIEKNLQDIGEKLELLISLLETLLMYDFETNKKKTLIFQKVPNDKSETPKSLEKKVKSLIKLETNIHNNVELVSVKRVDNGQKVDPIHVKFDKLVDKENVLEKSEALKKSYVVIEEHLPKNLQNKRKELRKILRVLKRGNPDKPGYLQYDKLFVDGKTFFYDEITRNVIEKENTQALKR